MLRLTIIIHSVFVEPCSTVQLESRVRLAASGWELGGEEDRSKLPKPTKVLKYSAFKPRILDGTEHLAVLLTGTRDRLMLAPLLTHVLAPSISAGYKVDVYLRLVARTEGRSNGDRGAKAPARYMESPSLANLPAHIFTEHVREAVEATGARAMHVELLNEPETLDPFPSVAARRNRISQYSPYDSNSTKAAGLGRSILRRFLSSKLLWHAAQIKEATDKFTYKWVLWLREDGYWLSPLQLQFFPQEEGLYTRNCHTEWGVSDKALLMTRVAAPVLLGAYDAWYNSSAEILDVKNPEMFMLALAMLGEVKTYPVPFQRLPVTDAMFFSTGQGQIDICLKKSYVHGCREQVLTEHPQYCSERLISK